MKCSACKNNILEDTKFCGSKINNNNYQKKENLLYILSIICILLSCIAVFLPYTKIFGIIGSNYFEFSKTYAINNLVIVFNVISLICLLMKKNEPVLILELFSVLIFIYNWVSITYTKEDYSNIIKFSTGFYLLLITTIVIIVLTCMRLNNKYNEKQCLNN